jgi:hypothetical protein
MSSVGISIAMYPCDLGYGATSMIRGYHHFQANPQGVVVCIYCGKFPTP